MRNQHIILIERNKMSSLLKIIVTDSGGVEHIFNEIPHELEHWISLKDDDGHVSITTRTFEPGSDRDAKCDTEINTTFIAPRIVVALYVPKMFDDALARLERTEYFINKLRGETSCNHTKDAIDDFFGVGA